MDFNTLKYAITVDNYQSISKAAEALFLSQPNITKAIKNLEQEIGFNIFIRSSKGVKTTNEGRNFLDNARKLLKHFSEFENNYKNDANDNVNLSISYPRATYLSYAICLFINSFNFKKANIGVYETNSSQTINHLINGLCGMGIIRFNTIEQEYIKHITKLYNLELEPFFNYQMEVLIHNSSDLSDKTFLQKDDLKNYYAITHSNPEISDLDFIKKNYYFSEKTIKVSERGSQFTILSNIKNSYIFVSPMPEKVLKDVNCKTIKYYSDHNFWQDAFIYKKNHSFTPIERKLKEYIINYTNTKKSPE